jgi:hypothetical protein
MGSILNSFWNLNVVEELHGRGHNNAIRVKCFLFGNNPEKYYVE